MQINLSTSLPGPTGEATAKSTESAGVGSASSFFAQMGQLWNPDSENDNSHDLEKPVVQNGSTVSMDPMSMLLGATMLSLNPIKAEPIPNSDLSILSSPVIPGNNDQDLSTQESDSPVVLDRSLNELTVSAINESLNDLAVNALKETTGPFAASESSQLPTDGAYYPADVLPQSQTISVQSFPIAFEMGVTEQVMPNSGDSMPRLKQGTENPLAESQTISPEVIAGWRTILPDLDPKGEKPQVHLENQNSTSLSPTQNALAYSHTGSEDTGNSRISKAMGQREGNVQAPVLDKMEGVPFASSEPIEINEHHAAQETRPIKLFSQTLFQSETETAQKNLAPQLETHAEPKLPSGSDWSAVKPDPGSAAPPLLAQDSKAQEHNSQTATPRNVENIVQAAAGNANTGGSNANQDQTPNEFIERQAVKSKSDNGQAAVLRKPNFPLADHPQEMQPALTSNTARIAEPNSFADALPATAAPPQSRELIFQLADQIKIQLRNGKGEIRIQLKPDSLGRIEIRAETTLTGVTARITTESGNVKNYLENNLQLLQQTLTDQGLRVDRIQINVQDAFDPQFSSGYNAQFGHAGSGRNGRNSNGFSGASGSLNIDPLEEITVDPQTWLALNPNNKFYTVA
jgi:flagellar hook-length control protein FliK